jgi:glycine hydroxymethyltransferase
MRYHLKKDWFSAPLRSADRQVASLIEKERARQVQTLPMIASENYVSRAVLEAQGSVLTNKYAEGLIGKREYSGCDIVDRIEILAKDRAKKLFGAEYANVEPYSGTQANQIVYFAVLKPRDGILGMRQEDYGHLTHGNRESFSGTFYNSLPYHLDRRTEQIDFDSIARITRRRKPRLIVAGYSCYPRKVDFAQFREIADSAGAYLLCDIAHLSGLIAAKLHENPLPFTDFATTTTHKMLRGPRGGLILTKSRFEEQIEKAVCPGIQGGALMHAVAAKAVAFKEAATAQFRAYMRKVVRNAAALAEELQRLGFKLFAGGTDTHMVVFKLEGSGTDFKTAQDLLENAGITTNGMPLPFSPSGPGAVRVGSLALTTRGMGLDEMKRVAGMIVRVLNSGGTPALMRRLRREVAEIAKSFSRW